MFSFLDTAVASKGSSNVSTFCSLLFMQCECVGDWIEIYVLLMPKVFYSSAGTTKFNCSITERHADNSLPV